MAEMVDARHSSSHPFSISLRSRHAHSVKRITAVAFTLQRPLVQVYTLHTVGAYATRYATRQAIPLAEGLRRARARRAW